MTLTSTHTHILFHSLGLDDNGHGRMYRNYYCQGIDRESPDLTAIRELVAAGLMREADKINGGNDQYFIVTEAGRRMVMQNVKPLPKLTKGQRRYKAFMRLDFGITFKEFLTDPAFAELRESC